MLYPRYLALCLLLSIPALARAAAPDLAMDPAEVDLGRQPQNHVAAAVVKLTNPTSEPITIERVEGDCGCTTGQLAEWRIAPGATTRLVVHLETRAVVGNLHHHLFLITTAGRQTIPVTALIYRSAPGAPPPPSN